jgi:hypothetical protein
VCEKCSYRPHSFLTLVRDLVVEKIVTEFQACKHKQIDHYCRGTCQNLMKHKSIASKILRSAPKKPNGTSLRTKKERTWEKIERNRGFSLNGWQGGRSDAIRNPECTLAQLKELLHRKFYLLGIPQFSVPTYLKSTIFFWPA